MQETVLVEVLRAGQVEATHSVSFAIADTNGHLIGSWGNPDLVTFLRSSAKPFQAVTFVESGAADHFDFESGDLALVCASHSGTELHVEKARQLLVKIGESERALQCGTHIPYDEQTYEELLRTDRPLNPVRNNCSGKHTGMLGLAKYMGDDLNTYLTLEHPVQEWILRVISDMAEVPIDSVVTGVDGCSAPTFALPLHTVARAYARLVDPETLGATRSAACRRIFAAMTGFPELVGGPGRFDTLFMRAVGGRMMSKSGAEGFQSIGIPRNVLKEGSPAIGIAIKVHDGDHKNHRAGALTAIEIIARLGGFQDGERAVLKSFDVRPVRNLRDLCVGELRINPVFEPEFNLDHERL